MEERNDELQEGRPEEDYTPRGAIFVTTFLAMVILLGWFGVYLLNILRG